MRTRASAIFFAGAAGFPAGGGASGFGGRPFGLRLSFQCGRAVRPRRETTASESEAAMSRQARGASWAFAVNLGFSRAAPDPGDGQGRRKGAFVERRERPHGTPRDAGVAAAHGSRRCPDGPLRQFLRPPMVSRFVGALPADRGPVRPGVRAGERSAGFAGDPNILGWAMQFVRLLWKMHLRVMPFTTSAFLKNDIPGEAADDDKAVRSFARVGPARDFAASQVCTQGAASSIVSQCRRQGCQATN